MTSGMQTVIYPVRDLPRATSLFRTLFGAGPVVEAPYYVQFSVDGQDVGLDPNGHRQGMTGPLGYYAVDDVRARIAELVGAGAQVVQDVRDVGGGKLIATVEDPDGNRIGLMQNP
jgi:predicted enzyme related to lactoylglutathione lyase